jgi:uncharacterized membrane protein
MFSLVPVRLADPMTTHTWIAASTTTGTSMSTGLRAAVLTTTLGCGLVAGTFFAFSSFIMPALNRLAPTQAIGAMQSINKLAVTPLFMLAVFGTAILGVVVAVWSVRIWSVPGAKWVLAGCVLYLLGAIIVTIAANVPLNNALAVVDPHAATAPGSWAHYMRSWTAWNHVRAVASLGATALLTVGLMTR